MPIRYPGQSLSDLSGIRVRFRLNCTGRATAFTLPGSARYFDVMMKCYSTSFIRRCASLARGGVDSHSFVHRRCLILDGTYTYVVS